MDCQIDLSKLIDRLMISLNQFIMPFDTRKNYLRLSLDTFLDSRANVKAK